MLSPPLPCFFFFPKKTDFQLDPKSFFKCRQLIPFKCVCAQACVRVRAWTRLCVWCTNQMCFLIETDVGRGGGGGVRLYPLMFREPEKIPRNQKRPYKPNTSRKEKRLKRSRANTSWEITPHSAGNKSPPWPTTHAALAQLCPALED